VAPALYFSVFAAEEPDNVTDLVSPKAITFVFAPSTEIDVALTKVAALIEAVAATAVAAAAAALKLVAAVAAAAEALVNAVFLAVTTAAASVSKVVARDCSAEESSTPLIKAPPVNELCAATAAALY